MVRIEIVRCALHIICRSNEISYEMDQNDFEPEEPFQENVLLSTVPLPNDGQTRNKVISVYFMK